MLNIPNVLLHIECKCNIFIRYALIFVLAVGSILSYILHIYFVLYSLHTTRQENLVWRTFWVHGAINQNHKCLNHSFASHVSDNLLLTHQFYDAGADDGFWVGDLPIVCGEIKCKKNAKSK